MADDSSRGTPLVSRSEVLVFSFPLKKAYFHKWSERRKENFFVKKHRRLIVVIIGKNKDDGKKSHKTEGRKLYVGFLFCVFLGHKS